MRKRIDNIDNIARVVGSIETDIIIIGNLMQLISTKDAPSKTQVNPL